MRKRLITLGILLFIVAVSISYILSNVVNTIDSNEMKEPRRTTQNSGISSYILVFLFIVLVYLIYHAIYVEMRPRIKMRKIKGREDPMEFMEYLSEEIRKSKKDKKKQEELIDRLNNFYAYSEKSEKEKAMKIGAIRKYLKKV
jgi:predicted PurR-regulated permease PerM